MATRNMYRKFCDVSTRHFRDMRAFRHTYITIVRISMGRSKYRSIFQQQSADTNVIHNFTAVSFSMKRPSSVENVQLCEIQRNPLSSTNFNALSFIYKVVDCQRASSIQTLSTAACHTLTHSEQQVLSIYTHNRKVMTNA